MNTISFGDFYFLLSPDLRQNVSGDDEDARMEQTATAIDDDNTDFADQGGSENAIEDDFSNFQNSFDVVGS